MNTEEKEPEIQLEETPKAKKPAKKPTKKPVAKKAPAKKKASKKTEDGYGVDYIAKALGKKSNLVRILLRKKKVKKPGKAYIWSSKSEIDSVVKQLKAA